VKTAGIAKVAPGGKIKAIQKDGIEFTLQFEDGSSVTLQLADPASPVAVRDSASVGNPSSTPNSSYCEQGTFACGLLCP
jgi:hypothetical protein